jgi:cytidylate kinase
LKLRGDKKNAQLICLLHGPGGSGKSTVINMVQAYAKSFCESMGHPYTTRTIIITAMSGVAATLLHGETTHSVIGLNREKITEDEIDAFSDARLLIIDEISFASRQNFVKMYD